MLTPEQQAKLAAAFGRETIDIPEVGGSITIRKLDAGRDEELNRLQYRLVPTGATDPKGKPEQKLVVNLTGYNFRRVAAAECDDQGRYAYPLAEQDHAAFDAAVAAMQSWPPDVFARALAAVRKLDPIIPDGPEDAAKN
jgi:hypothetical protein